MKTLSRTMKEMAVAGRWDIDFHLPAQLIQAFDASTLRRVDAISSIVRESRDPSAQPEQPFEYIDIASVDVSTGTIAKPQSLLGEVAPLRARKVVNAFDIVVSTVRPTRGAVAVVPEELHGQIASTGFTIVRANRGVNPFFLHFVLRLPSTREQFRKWSTGSSYPAILDNDVAKTLVPVPDAAVQDEVAAGLWRALDVRRRAIANADSQWDSDIASLVALLGADLSDALVEGEEAESATEAVEALWSGEPTVEAIDRARDALDARDQQVLDE